jgi:hypothetical protein
MHDGPAVRNPEARRDPQARAPAALDSAPVLVLTGDTMTV